MKSWLKTLSGYVEEQRKEWARANPSRLKFEPGLGARIFQSATSRPNVWAIAAFVLGLLVTLASAFFAPPPYTAPFSFAPTNGKYEPATALLGLWAVQAAMVAVVYPIVVAFVTVLIQRQAASKASLEAYFVSSGAKLTGLSSLWLVLLMGVQFVLLDTVPLLTGFAWVTFDTAWFLVNSLLTIRFLGATFQFASPEGRVRARNWYVLTRAWPDEWAFHLSRLVARQPSEHGLLDVPSAVKDLKAATAAFSPHPYGFGTEAALLLRFRGSRSISDIRYRILGWAYALWQKQIVPLPDAKDSKTHFSRVGPTLEMGVNLHEDFSHSTPAFRVGKAQKPSLAVRLLLRAAIEVSQSIRSRVTVLDAIDEARLDAVNAIHQDSVSDFEKRLEEMIDFFDEVVESSNYIKDGKADNWTLLQNSSNLWNEQPVGQAWEKAFLDLHSVALSAIETRQDFAQGTIRVPSRFFLRQSEFLCAALKGRYLVLQYRHIRLLLDWAAERVTLSEGGVGGRFLEEPLRRRYERLVKDAVSSWESLRGWRLGFGLDDVTEWGRLQEVAPLMETHLRQSAGLVASALRSDDRVGLYWLGDSFFKWRAQLDRSSRSDGVAYPDRFKVTYNDLLLNFSQFREKFPLSEYENEDEDTTKAAWNLALRNFWVDVGLVLLATCVKNPGARETQYLLSAEFVRTGLIGARRDTASAGSERLVDSADQVISSVIRIHALENDDEGSYPKRLEALAESLAPSAVFDGIAGRVYSSSGSPLDVLDSGYIFAMAYLTSKPWKVSPRFDDSIRGWIDRDDIRQRLRYQLVRLRDRAASQEIQGQLGPFWRLVCGELDFDLRQRLDWVVAALTEFIERIDTVRASDIQTLEVSGEELGRLQGYATTAFDKPLGEAPLGFFDKVTQGAGPFTQNDVVTVRITGWDKGTLTDPRLSDSASNEDEYLRNAIRQSSATNMIGDLLKATNVRLQGVSSRDDFVNEVETYGKQIAENGNRGILLVSSRVDPVWLVELGREGTEANGPPVFRRSFSRNREPSFCGTIGSTEVHIAPVPTGECILCTDSLFKELAVSDTVSVETKPEKDAHRCTLVFHWFQKASLGDEPVIRLQYQKPRRRQRDSAKGR